MASAACSRCPPRPSDRPRPASLRSLTRSGFAARSDGSNPTASVVKIAIPMVKAATRQSSSKVNHYGSGSGNEPIIQSIAHCETIKPMIVPGTASSTLSVSATQISRPPLAPIAERTASSR